MPLILPQDPLDPSAPRQDATPLTDGSTGSPPSAFRFSVMERGVEQSHYPPMVRLWTGFNQTIVTGQFITISNASNIFGLTFGQEVFDTDNMWNVGTPGRITIQTPGVYNVYAAVAFADPYSGSRYLALRMNATLFVAYHRVTAASTADTQLQVTAIRQFVQGDYIEALVYTNPTNPTFLRTISLGEAVTPVFGANLVTY